MSDSYDLLTSCHAKLTEIRESHKQSWGASPEGRDYLHGIDSLLTQIRCHLARQETSEFDRDLYEDA